MQIGSSVSLSNYNEREAWLRKTEYNNESEKYVPVSVLNIIHENCFIDRLLSCVELNTKVIEVKIDDPKICYIPGQLVYINI